jgi:PmbA protein
MINTNLVKTKYFEQAFMESQAERLMSKLKKQPDIKHFEIYLNSHLDKSIEYEEGFVKAAHQKSTFGIGLRLIGTEGREGMTFSSDYSDRALEQILINGTKMMKAATPNPDFKSLAYPSKFYQKVEGIYDPGVEELAIEDLDQIFDPIFALKQKNLAPVGLSGGFSATLGAVYIVNSNGIQNWELATNVGISASVNLLKDDNFGSGFYWQSSPCISALNTENVAYIAYDMAFRGLNKHPMETGEYPIVLSPIATANFLVDPILAGINAESVQNHMSFLCDKLNQPIGVDLLTIEDNPHIKGQIGTQSFDDEGVATRPMKIIEGGILKDLYHNSFTAGKAGCESNGHATRAGYAGRVMISNHNVQMEPGSRKKDDLIAEIKKGIYFEYTGDSPNAITGDFSGLIMHGYVIEDGQIGDALLETLIGINLLDAYKRIEIISKERQWVDDHYMPWVKLSSATISSRA